MFTHTELWSAIDALAKTAQLSASGLARRAGLDPTTFNKSKRFATDGRPRWPSTESLAKILELTATDMATFANLLALQKPQALCQNQEQQKSPSQADRKNDA